MTGEQIFKYVRHADVERWMDAGWALHDSLHGCHHGDWSALMEWTLPTEPVIPKADDEKAT